jgi:uncharacterized protein DUF2530
VRLPPRRPDPEPLEVDDAKVVAFGTALWVAAFVALLVAYLVMGSDHPGVLRWMWTALAGAGLGLYGIRYCRRRQEAVRLSSERAER